PGKKGSLRLWQPGAGGNDRRSWEDGYLNRTATLLSADRDVFVTGHLADKGRLEVSSLGRAADAKLSVEKKLELDSVGVGQNAVPFLPVTTAALGAGHLAVVLYPMHMDRPANRPFELAVIDVRPETPKVVNRFVLSGSDLDNTPALAVG